MTGTNVHAIVEQAPVPAPESGAPGDTPATPGIDGALLFALSASSQDALRQTAARLADWVDAQGPELAPADLAYTLARRRGHRPVRTAVLAATTAELTEALRKSPPAKPLPTRGRPRRPRTGLGVLRARLAMGGHGRRPAGHRTGIRRHHRRDRTTDRRGIRLLGDRSHDRPRGRDRHRPGATDPVCHAGRAGGHNEVLRRSARRGHRPLAGRVRGRGGRRRALPRRRSARHLPAVGADDPYRRRRRHGIGGTACSTSAFGVDGARRQRRRGRGGGLPAVHRDRRGHPDGTRPGGRLGATRRAGP